MEKSTQRPITVARLRSKPTRDGRARRIGGTGVIVRGPGVRRTQGQSTRSSKTAAPGLPREVNLSMATLCSAGVPSTSNASSMSRHTVSAIPLTKSLAFVPSRFSSGNSLLRRPLQARQGRQGYSSSASGRLLYSETDDRGKVPLPPACPGAATGRRGLCIRRRSSWFLRPQSRRRVDLRVRVLDSNF